MAEKEVRLQKAELQATDAKTAANRASTALADDRQAVTTNEAAVATLQTSVNNVRTHAAALARNMNYETDQLKKERANPTTLYYKGISIAHGGFLAADTVYRSKGTGSDILTPFNNLPFSKVPSPLCVPRRKWYSGQRIGLRSCVCTQMLPAQGVSPCARSLRSSCFLALRS